MGHYLKHEYVTTVVSWAHAVFIDSPVTWVHVCASTWICVERKQTGWLERTFQQLTVGNLRLMYKKLYTCLQLGDEKTGFFFLTFDENWLQMSVNRLKSKTAQTCTLRSATSYLDGSKNIYYSKRKKSIKYLASQMNFSTHQLLKILELTEPKWLCILHLFS